MHLIGAGLTCLTGLTVLRAEVKTNRIIRRSVRDLPVSGLVTPMQ